MILRWVCKGCAKKYLYPVESCIHCNGSTEKQVGKKLKVVGNTTVAIPSLNHPIIPYNILILEDEHGNRMPKKTLKEYAIGDEFNITPTASDHGVAIVKIKYDILEAIKEALRLIGDIDVSNKTKILIKPAILAPAHPYTAVNTNPNTLDALLQLLKEKGAAPENITIAEQVPNGKSEPAALKSGIAEVCMKHKVQMLDLATKNFEEKQAGSSTFEVSEEILNKDLIINLPVLKTHQLLSVAGAVENMSRVLSQKNFEELQAKNPMEALALLPKVLPKMITIADGTIGQQGNAPQQGVPAFLNIILASKDPVALDKVFQEMYQLKKAIYLEMAGKLGTGETNLEKIEIVGDEFKACSYPILKPNLIKPKVQEAKNHVH